MIKVTNLEKHYGPIAALRGISFEIEKGEIVGFLGPNGAGKTTTMKILTGFTAPSRGAVSIDGLNAFEAPVEVKRRIGYLPESTPLYPDMRVWEYLEWVAQMRGVPRSEWNERIPRVVTQCGMWSFLGQPIGTLSKGQRQRTGLAQALLHDPPFLILDEPTSGLDPNQIVEIRSLIRELGRNHTIILSTHNLPEVQQTCTRILIIHRGRIVADGTAEELEQRAASEQLIRYEVGTAAGQPVDATELTTAVRALPQVARATLRGTTSTSTRLEVVGKGQQDVRPALYELAVERGWKVYELHREALDLEGIFRRLTAD